MVVMVVVVVVMIHPSRAAVIGRCNTTKKHHFSCSDAIELLIYDTEVALN